MSLSASQRALLMSKPCRSYPTGGLWWQACQRQGWAFEDRDRRLQVLSQAAGKELESASYLDNKGFDRVKARLLTLADRVSAAAEEVGYEQGLDPGEARRTMNHVRELLAELEALHPEPGEYVRTLLVGIKRGQRVDIGGVEELGTAPRFFADGAEKISELEQFRRTLNARIHGKNGLAQKGISREAGEGSEGREAEELEGVPF